MLQERWPFLFKIQHYKRMDGHLFIMGRTPLGIGRSVPHMHIRNDLQRFLLELFRTSIELVEILIWLGFFFFLRIYEQLKGCEVCWLWPFQSYITVSLKVIIEYSPMFNMSWILSFLLKKTLYICLWLRLLLLLGKKKKQTNSDIKHRSATNLFLVPKLILLTVYNL